jgi:hypothetical protein
MLLIKAADLDEIWEDEPNFDLIIEHDDENETQEGHEITSQAISNITAEQNDVVMATIEKGGKDTILPVEIETEAKDVMVQTAQSPEIAIRSSEAELYLESVQSGILKSQTALELADEVAVNVRPELASSPSQAISWASSQEHEGQETFPGDDKPDDVVSREDSKEIELSEHSTCDEDDSIPGPENAHFSAVASTGDCHMEDIERETIIDEISEMNEAAEQSNVCLFNY